jgi:hypothetical protein
MKNRFALGITVTAILLLLEGAIVPMSGQAIFRSQASGAWGTSGTWLLVSGTDADGVPDANDSAVVVTGTIVTVAGTNADCSSLTLDNGGTVQMTGAGNLRVNGTTGRATINGTLTIAGAGTLRKQGTGTRTLSVGPTGWITISGSAPTPVFDVYAIDNASTMEFTATADQTIQSGIIYGNLNLAGSGNKTVGPIPADTAFQCNGKVTIAAGVRFDVSTNILHVRFNGDMENHGTLDASVGVVMLTMTGGHWMNYGTFLASTTSGFGYTPAVTFINTVVGGSPVAQTFYDLIVQGSMSAGSGFTVQRNVLIQPGGTFDAGSGLTHTVGGNWTNAGTFVPGSSTITFNGTALQDIGASVFANVVINNAAGVQLTGNVSIAAGRSLTLTSGNLSTGVSTLSILSNSASALVTGANTITGTIQREIAAGSTGTYLLFGQNAYVIPGGTDNPTSITGTVFPGVNPPNMGGAVDTSHVARRYFTLTATGAGPGFTYAIRLPYLQSEVRGDESKYSIWQDSGIGWGDVGVSAAPDTANNFVQQTGLLGFSNWLIGEASGSLPIQLSSFHATVSPEAGDVTLNWSTSSEIMNFGFYVQRSSSPVSGFVDLPNNFLPGAGTTLEPRHYAWTEKSMVPGTYYYRLKQVDADGSIHPTDAIKVTVGNLTGVQEKRKPVSFELEQNYPNPFNPSTRIEFSVETAGYTTLKVYSILGEEIATLYAGFAQPGIGYSVNFVADARANGAYFYRLVSGEKTSMKKMILLK